MNPTSARRQSVGGTAHVLGTARKVFQNQTGAEQSLASAESELAAIRRELAAMSQSRDRKAATR